MSYEKNLWACGDEITAEKLNHMEDGIANAGGGGGSLRVTFTQDYDYDTGEDLFSYDKTGEEIINAIRNGQMVYFDRISNTSEEQDRFYPTKLEVAATDDDLVTEWRLFIVQVAYNTRGYATTIATHLLQINYGEIIGTSVYNSSI